MNNVDSESLSVFLQTLLRQGVADGVFPGAAAAVALGCGDQRQLCTATTGTTRLDDQGTPIQPDTFFDLASLSKALATTLLLLDAMEQGLLRPENKYSELCRHPLPEDKKNITIGQLLCHASGLPAYHSYYQDFTPVPDPDSRERLLAAIRSEPLAYQPGTTCEYSDLGFLLLGDLLEELSQTSLDTLFIERISRPLGIEEEVFYRPLSSRSHSCVDNHFAATEYCPWRDRILQGEVHDEHCFLFGGVSGHAGLFGTARGVAYLCGTILDTWQGQSTSLPISPSLMQQALRPQLSGQTWRLGFDTPSPTDYTSAGQYLSRASIGHLGYAGTSFWIDPDHAIIMILLTNRVHPSRKNTKIREFRPWFHDRIMEYFFPAR